MGAALGRLVGTQALASVVDLSGLGSSAARHVFMAAFTETLYGANTHSLHLALYEADLWAPQRVQASGRELLDHIEEIVRRGRVRGFVPWLITQRPAVLHKDVLSQADVLLSMKFTASQAQDAAVRCIKGQTDRRDGQRILAALPRLKQGEGYVWVPAQAVLARVQFLRIQTLDSFNTLPWSKNSPTKGTLAEVDVATIVVALNDLHAMPTRARL